MIPVIQTANYCLVGIEPSDQEFIFRGLSHPQVIPYYGVRYSSYEGTAVQMEWYRQIWREGTGCWWKIKNQVGEAVGAAGINAYDVVKRKAEIGYWLLPEYWRMGVMKEVLPAMIQHVFRSWNLDYLEAVVEVGNVASASLALQVGFEFDSFEKEGEIKEGRLIDLEIYLLRKENVLI